MRGKYYKLKLIEILKEAPLFSYAAKKVGVARSTLYRWYNSDPEFRQAVDSAQEEGRGQFGDLAEMKLIEKVKEKDMGAIKFFLVNNNKRYMPRRDTALVPPQHKLKPGQWCRSCGHEELPEMSAEEIHKRIKKGIVDLQDLDRQFDESDVSGKPFI